MLVRAAEAKAQLAATELRVPAAVPAADPAPWTTPIGATDPRATAAIPPPRNRRRFYGSVEIDMVRPVKAFDMILNAVVMELRRTQGSKVKLTLETKGEAPEGCAESAVSIVRDNAKQLKFKPELTGFED